MGLTKAFCFAILIVFYQLSQRPDDARGAAVGVGKATTEAVVGFIAGDFDFNFFLTMFLNIIFPAGWI